MDNVDAFSMQEVLTPGQLYGAVLKDIVVEKLRTVRQVAVMQARRREYGLKSLCLRGGAMCIVAVSKSITIWVNSLVCVVAYDLEFSSRA